MTGLRVGEQGKYFQVDPFGDGNWKLCQCGQYDYSIGSENDPRIKMWQIGLEQRPIVDCPLSQLGDGETEPPTVFETVDDFLTWLKANFFF